MNNDIIGLAGVSILICALIVGIKRGWELTSAAMLAVGIVVCALGYYCTYGFILAGIVTFIISCLSQNRDDLAHAWKTIGLTALVCALCTFPFFGVNIVRYGDPIGSRAFGQAYEKWLADGGEVVRWPANTGFVSLILNEDYIDRTTKSFIGMFGYLSEPLHEIVRLFLGATLVFLSGALFGCRELASRVFSKRWRVFSISLIVAALITVAMHLWYSNGTDYEPQGRYVIDLLVPWCVMAGIGAFCIFGSSRLGLGICAAVYTMICVGSVLLVMRNGAWPGIMASQDMYLNMVIP